VSLDLLSALISEHDDLPLLVVFTARPGFLEASIPVSGQRATSALTVPAG
jgi:hypothetical protein